MNIPKLDKLNPAIYNRLVKRFTTFMSEPHIAECPVRCKMFLEIRKKFPTYNELLAKDLWYSRSPRAYIGPEIDDVMEMKSFLTGDNCIDGVAVIYDIGFMDGRHPKTLQPLIALIVRGVPTVEKLKEEEEVNFEPGRFDKDIALLNRV